PASWHACRAPAPDNRRRRIRPARPHPERGSMRPRRTLTARGVCMLVFGTAALVAGLVVEQFELAAVGVFLICLPPLSALSLLGAEKRVVHSRLVHPSRVHAGQAARVMV